MEASEAPLLLVLSDNVKIKLSDKLRIKKCTGVVKANL